MKTSLVNSCNLWISNIQLRNLMISSLCCIVDMERTVWVSNWNRNSNSHCSNKSLINSTMKNNSSKNLVSKTGNENYSRNLFKHHRLSSNSTKKHSLTTLLISKIKIFSISISLSQNKVSQSTRSSSWPKVNTLSTSSQWNTQLKTSVSLIF